jgi:hypothetical protein
VRIAAFVFIGLIALVGCYAIVSATILNPRVIRDLESNPDGERARKAMVLTLPSGKTIPVNYLQDGETVYAAADFPWWRELRGAGGDVEVLIRGALRRGHARAVEDDPALRTSVFERLRPTAPAWTGVLVEIGLDVSS